MKRSILAIIDKPKWAVDNQVSQVAGALGEYSWTKVFHGDHCDIVKLGRDHDLIWLGNHNTGPRYQHALDELQHPRVLITFRSWRYKDTVRPFMASGLVHVATAVSRDLTAHVSKYFNPVHYISEAVPGLFHPSRPRRIGFVGEPVEYKGFPLIATAVSNLGFELVVAPRSSDEHGKNMPQSEMPRFYEFCDAVVVASEQEGGGTIAMEAMAMNVPVLTTRVGVAAGLDCMFIDRSIEGIEAGLRKLFGRPKVFPEFSSETVNAKWAELFGGLLR